MGLGFEGPKLIELSYLCCCTSFWGDGFNEVATDEGYDVRNKALPRGKFIFSVAKNEDEVLITRL